jgi:molecular chaperone IbpA
MLNIDLYPLYRSFIGFDQLASIIFTASKNEKQTTYPPYNIELLAEDKYRITMAIAGFADHEVSIEVQENTLQVIGTKSPKESNDPSGIEERKFLHKGISERSFERKFQLGDHVKVLAADLENGLLHIDLERVVPESKKPRKIEIRKKFIENNE